MYVQQQKPCDDEGNPAVWTRDNNKKANETITGSEQGRTSFTRSTVRRRKLRGSSQHSSGSQEDVGRIASSTEIASSVDRGRSRTPGARSLPSTWSLPTMSLPPEAPYTPEQNEAPYTPCHKRKSSDSQSQYSDTPASHRATQGSTQKSASKVESKDEQAAKESETVKFLMEKESLEKILDGMLKDDHSTLIDICDKLRQISQMSIANEHQAL